MRLINVHSLELKEFHFETAPEYVALSHRWGDDEINYEDFINKNKEISTGYKKIAQLCEFVKWNARPEREVSWAWVDTCCIDKRSSAELSEAINSMWAWYRNCDYCVVYLEDFTAASVRKTFWKSKWFTRGWTLQELLAPESVLFCTRDWKQIGWKSEPEIINEIAMATGIEADYLKEPDSIQDICAATKLSWASKRVTTREEDQAYCLLGLLDINMPLLYGEGGTRAFLRLQEEFIRRSDDESIFAWTTPHIDAPTTLCGMLADSPYLFNSVGNINTITHRYDQYAIRPPYTVTNKGLQFVAKGVRINPLLSSTDELQPKTWPSRENDTNGKMESSMNEPTVGESFILSLNCTTDSQHHVTCPRAVGHGLALPSAADLILLVFLYSGEGRWYRWLPNNSHRKRFAELWSDGPKTEGIFLMQLQSVLWEIPLP